MSKKRTTGNADCVQCPTCEATLDLRGLNPSNKGFQLRCSGCKRVLVTVGGMIAAISGKPLQSISLEDAGDSAQSLLDVPLAPLAPFGA